MKTAFMARPRAATARPSSLFLLLPAALLLALLALSSPRTCTGSSAGAAAVSGVSQVLTLAEEEAQANSVGATRAKGRGSSDAEGARRLLLQTEVRDTKVVTNPDGTTTTYTTTNDGVTTTTTTGTSSDGSVSGMASASTSTSGGSRRRLQQRGGRAATAVSGSDGGGAQSSSSVTNPDGTITTTSVDARGVVTTVVTDAQGNVISETVTPPDTGRRRLRRMLLQAADGTATDGGTAPPPPAANTSTAGATLPGDVIAVRSCLPFTVLVLPGSGPNITSSNNTTGTNATNTNTTAAGGGATGGGATGGAATTGGGGGGNATILMDAEPDVINATDISYSAADGILTLALAQVGPCIHTRMHDVWASAAPLPLPLYTTGSGRSAVAPEQSPHSPPVHTPIPSAGLLLPRGGSECTLLCVYL